jgi:hypothetical protein
METIVHTSSYKSGLHCIASEFKSIIFPRTIFGRSVPNMNEIAKAVFDKINILHLAL